MHSLARTKLARRLRLQPVIYLGLVALLLGSLGMTGWQAVSAQTAAPTVTIAPVDAINPPIEQSVLSATLSGFDGNTAAYTYQWLRSAAQSDANYQATQDTDPATPTNRYNLDLNGSNDVGYRFKLQVTDSSGHTALSNVVAVGPNTPTLLHPARNEVIRVRIPYFNVQKGNDPNAYLYEIEVATNPAFTQNRIVSSVGERPDNNNVTFWRFPDRVLQPGQTYYWKVRAVVAGAPGRWATEIPFSIAPTGANLWSEESGGSWHWPLDDTATPLSGMFKEAYAHIGHIGGLHGGIDIAACQPGAQQGQIVRAARGGIRTGGIAGPTGVSDGVALTLKHESVDLQSSYLHMANHSTLPRGTYINQGTALGVSSTVGGVPCHLHFDILNDSMPREWYNPLEYVHIPAINTRAPAVSEIYLRAASNQNYSYLSAANRNISGNVDIIAKIVEDSEASPIRTARLNPYRVDFFRNNVIQNTINFDTLSSGEHERQYYSFNSPQTIANDPNTPGNDRGDGNTYYLMYYRWNTANLPEDAGPQAIRVVAYDYEMVHRGSTVVPGERVLRIGPDLTAAPATVTIDRCNPQPQNVTLTINNRNHQIQGINNDTYQLSLRRNGATATLGQASITVANNAAANVTLVIPGTSSGGTVRVIAASGIVRNIRDAVDIQVNVVGNCPTGDSAPRRQFSESLAIQVDENGRFNIGAAPDPLTGEANGTASSLFTSAAAGASWSLSHGWPAAPGSSFTTLRVDGANYIYGSSGTVLSAPANTDSRSNRSAWQFGKIEIAQTLQLTRTNLLDPLAPEDAVSFVYTVRNTDSVAHSVGMRVLLDTDIASSAQQFRVGGSAVTSERAYAGAAIPDALQVASDQAPTRSAVATLRGAGISTPDRLILASWSRLSSTTYAYTIDPARPISQDGAYALYWDPQPLGPGESRTYITRYGRAPSGSPAVTSVRR